MVYCPSALGFSALHDCGDSQLRSRGGVYKKRFKDEVYRPVWEHMGIWHSYSTITRRFEVVNTLSLTRMGSIHVKEVTYLDKEKSKQRLEKNLGKLRPGLLKG